jgi:hypothetical protein
VYTTHPVDVALLLVLQHIPECKTEVINMMLLGDCDTAAMLQQALHS